ncbi:MAG TPA: anthranilate phosphoribosyltransferase [Patescibacteria group bacterium]|nr:anthranilate phosphoribosyltransferase [Patescibacteria group bacterium]
MKIKEFLEQTIDGNLSLVEQKRYLTQNPFPPAEEIAEAVTYLYAQMPEIPDLENAIDICGTGGSGLARLNTSTISAFVVAGAGVKVAKHGNNAASGKFGSFDLLSALDIPINLSTQELQLRFNEYNLAFLYAKSFHPIMRLFAPVRAELDIPTFFNILGPLLSPVKAKRQLIGTPKLEYARLIAEVSRIMQKDRVIVAVGSDGLDEATLTGPTTIVELKEGKVKQYRITPEDFGIEPVSSFTEIESKGPDENIRIANDIIGGADNTRRTDLVLINSALAISLSNQSKNLEECYQLAKRSIDSGKAQNILNSYRTPAVLSKIAQRDDKRNFSIVGSLLGSDQEYAGGLIAEVKKRSPSEGDINASIDIVVQAKTYQTSGAAAISVLTESDDFGGSFEDLKKIRQAVDLPILCKDFIFRKEHIDKAKSCGADIILLIAAILDEEKLSSFHQYAREADLQVIVEVHSKVELDKALRCNPAIIGVNSRNLHDFSLDPKIFSHLSEKIPKGIIKIAESGIEKFSDVPPHYDGILVGTTLMKHPFPALKIKELSGKPILKLCGIRSVEDARLCEELGVDMIGINFVPRSKRKVGLDLAKDISAVCSRTLTVGIFENQDPREVNDIARQIGLDVIQLSGKEKDLDRYELPIIKTIGVKQETPAQALMSIIDGELPGSGKKIDHNILDTFQHSLIAGGIDLKSAEVLLNSKKPLGIDTASGIETDGKVDKDKILAFYQLVSSVSYL